MLECNNCGAPLTQPDEGADYVTCSYCQTVTALPRQAPPAPPPQPARVPESRPAITATSIANAASRGFSAIVSVFAGVIILGAGIQVWRGFQPQLTNLTKAGSLAMQDLAKAKTPETNSNVTLDAERITPKTRAGEASPADPKARRSGSGKKSTTATASASPTAEPSAAPAPKQLNVTTSGVRRASGDLPLDVVRSKLANLSSSFRRCYFEIRQTNPDTEGTLRMHFSIDAAGKVRGAGASNASVPMSLASCVNRALGATSFPPSNGTLEIVFQLRFSTE